MLSNPSFLLPSHPAYAQSLPSSLGQLFKLKTLKAANNRLLAIPNSIGNLNALQVRARHCISRAWGVQEDVCMIQEWGLGLSS